MYITFSQSSPRIRAQLYLKTPAAFERRSTNERLAASLAFARRARVRLDEFSQLTEHHYLRFETGQTSHYFSGRGKPATMKTTLSAACARR